jgi:hypothetical protein
MCSWRVVVPATIVAPVVLLLPFKRHEHHMICKSRMCATCTFLSKELCYLELTISYHSEIYVKPGFHYNYDGRHCLVFICASPMFLQGSSWPWSHGSWIFDYLCNQCLWPLMLWVGISIRAMCTTLCDKVYHWQQVGGFLRVLRFPPPIKLTASI